HSLPRAGSQRDPSRRPAAYLLVPRASLRFLRAFAAARTRGRHEAVPCGPGGGRTGNPRAGGKETRREPRGRCAFAGSPSPGERAV
ncbi:hypothetical protein P7K49_004350, partial [Saguinus oedipus]